MPGMGGGGASAGVLEPLRKQLFDNDLLKKMRDPAMQKAKNYRELHDKFMKRRADFLPKEKIVLVN